MSAERELVLRSMDGQATVSYNRVVTAAISSPFQYMKLLVQETNAKLEAANGDLSVMLEEANARVSSQPGSSDSSELKVPSLTRTSSLACPLDESGVAHQNSVA